jgi:hypothetical protein
MTMSQTTISNNGHSSTAPTGASVGPERRTTATPADPLSRESVSPEVLIERHVDSARRQLADARENLKAARRRVVQLEDALCNWERFATELRRSRGNTSS